ncbi:MAG: hypothetical protein CMJ18_04475 [Phycisphaeraceae bacterium]|nr:hypothetical protein [Phycisphaeraceae bacterium]
MPNLAAVIKDEIRRLARKEARAETNQLKKQSAQYRAAIAALKRQVDQQAKALAFLEKQERKRVGPEPSKPQTNGARFSARSVSAHRRRLGLSQADYGMLVGVSKLTIYNWEQGNSRPREAALSSLVALRDIGKREALKRLEMLIE